MTIEPSTPLVRRNDALAVLRRFLPDAAVDGGAFLLTGEPGVGKTALLSAAAETARAAGTTVL